MIIQNEPLGEGREGAELSFTVPREDLRVAREALEPLVGELGIGGDRHRAGRWARSRSSARG